MKKQAGVFVVVMALLVGAISGAAYAKSGARHKMDKGGKGEMKFAQMGGGMGMMGGMHNGMMLRNRKVQKELGLSEDQKAKLKDIFSDEVKKYIKGEAAIKILRLDLMDLMGAPMPDNAKIDSKIDEIASACADLAKIKIHAMQDAKSVLTPEQMDKWTRMKEKMVMGGKRMNEKREKKGMRKKGKGKKEKKGEQEEDGEAWELH